MDLTKTELTNRVFQSIPYPGQVEFIETQETDAIRFNWRGSVYRVSGKLLVEEVEDGMLAGSNEAILLRRLLELGRL